METRNILDYQGNVVGQMSLPDGTSEEIWQKKLATYSAAPSNPLEEMLTFQVMKGKEAADRIMDKIKKHNLSLFISSGLTNDQILLKSCWVHHRLRAIPITVGGISMTEDLLNMCISGDIETAYLVSLQITEDSMTEPHHYFSAQNIAFIQECIKAEL